jgi:amino acid adenylation domain-containing protein/thioester reductase-like protein
MADAPCSAGHAFDHGPFRAVPALIEEQADRHPRRPAVCYDGRTLTYAQLDRLANGLAAVLAGRGVGKGTVVPVLLVNSLELPVVYLALMKLGAVFVPLDPAWPKDRIRTALGVLPGGLILSAAPDAVPEEFRPLTLAVDVERITPAGRRPAEVLRPDDLIYGFFTSGTTGTPKCAMNRQEGLTNRFRFMTRYFAATGDEVVLQNSKHTFDSSLWQMLWPLTTGGRTVLPVQGEFLNLPQTIDTIVAHGVTATDFVSSVFNALVALVDGDEAAQRKLASLRWLIVGSEPLNPQAVHRLRTLLPGLRVANGYGPTEASIGMVFHTVSDSDQAMIPLGRPIDNCYAMVVGDDLAPLPAGATGEIAIGGACLGAGYLGDPAATAKAFVRNPFPATIPGDRLYLTGDLGHIDDHGRLLFSGRKDFQVKIGGVRIELGEIEVAAELCPGVSQAEVLVADQGGRRSLALFAAGTGLTEAGLRAHLSRRLPRTHLPRYYLLLPRMPLGDNGKIDRERLRATLDRRLADDAARLAEQGPATTLPEQVLRVFRSVLGDPGLASGTHFVDAGGDSIQALTVTRALRAECAVRLDVMDLFDHPTADEMALLIERRRSDGAIRQPEDLVMEGDARLPAGATIRAADPAAEPRAVLLTGATGFVGSRLVHALLTGTDLRVLCLVRAPDDAGATERVVAALAERGLWEARFADRLTGHAGDLGRPGLGLAAIVWQHLARTCDLVVHGAAMVNFLFDYRAHRAVNVEGTAELLRLAMAHRPVPVHHVSTLAALLGTATRADRLPEHFEPSHAAMPHGGYNRSKWIAERYLAEARRRGALVTVLRLGEVMPSADNGAPNPLALTHLLSSAFERLGVRPAAPIRSDYTPVDYVAARTVAAVLDHDVWGRTLHVFHPQSVSFGDALSRAGTPIQQVPCAEFLARLRQAARESRDWELTTLAALLPSPSGADEPVLRRIIADLLTDNPALFHKDECRRLEERWQLTDGPLDGPLAAYRSHLTNRSRGVPAAVPPLPPPLPTMTPPMTPTMTTREAT